MADRHDRVQRRRVLRREPEPLEGIVEVEAPPGSDSPDESTAASDSPITTLGAKESRGDAAPEEQGQQAMIVVLLIALGVAFMLITVYILKWRDDGERRVSGILEALWHFLPWW